MLILIGFIRERKMNMTDPSQEYMNLSLDLHWAKYDYYVLDSPKLSDYAFDIKARRLDELEIEHPEWVTKYSVSNTVGCSERFINTVVKLAYCNQKLEKKDV